jgi:hypothetical protein
MIGLFEVTTIDTEKPLKNFNELFAYLDKKFIGQPHNPNTENNVKTILREFCHGQYCCGKINEEFRNELEEFLITRIQIK